MSSLWCSSVHPLNDHLSLYVHAVVGATCDTDLYWAVYTYLLPNCPILAFLPELQFWGIKRAFIHKKLQICLEPLPCSVGSVEFLGKEIGDLVDGDAFLALRIALTDGDGVIFQ